MQAFQKQEKMIYNKHILLAFDSGTTPQQISATINVPFNVGKIVVHPLTRYISNPNHKTDNFVLQCPAINPEGTGIIGTICGDNSQDISTKEMTFIYSNPMTFNGQHQFYLRCLTEAGGGASNPLTAKILLLIEFHQA